MGNVSAAVESMQAENQACSSSSNTLTKSSSTESWDDSTDTSSSDINIRDMTTIDFAADPRAHYTYHEKLLRDSSFHYAYWEAMVKNSYLLKDKIVLDVRCGIGMWSLYSVVAGAKHVYAIDDTAGIQLTRRVVRKNKYEHKITVIRGKIADIVLPVEKVGDIGYFIQSQSKIAPVAIS